MNIVSKIKQTVLGALGESYPFYYMSEDQTNLETGRMDFPCCVLRLITTGNTVSEAMQIKERVSAALFFLNLAEFDFDGEENEALIDARKEDAFTWLKSLGSDNTIQLEGEATTSRIYKEYDDIVTGYGLLVELRELSGFCE